MEASRKQVEMWVWNRTGNRLTGRSVSHKRENSALYICIQLTREKNLRKSGEDITLRGYLENTRRRCQRTHS